MKITTIGIDLAKEVFQIHGVDKHGKAVLRKRLRRSEMVRFFVNLEPCLIVMEACGSSPYWARKLCEFGHTVKLMSPQFVKPYVKTNKHDMADTEAICEAVSRPNMHFVPIENVEQQAILSVHRSRQGFVKTRTPQANQVRGLLSEFGIVIPQGIRSIHKRMPDILGDATEFKNGKQLSAWFGLVQKQRSSGGKQTLLGISKRGDTYLRTLLIYGARAVIRFAENKPKPENWLSKLIARRNKNVVAVALANMNTRIIWALLAARA